MNISVIGVSWTLAVIFVFYLLFPFLLLSAGKQETCMVGIYLRCNATISYAVHISLMKATLQIEWQ